MFQWDRQSSHREEDFFYSKTRRALRQAPKPRPFMQIFMQSTGRLADSHLSSHE